MTEEHRIEREYRYGPTWSSKAWMFALAVLFGLIALFFLLVASGTERRIGLFRGAVLLPEGSSKGLDVCGIMLFGALAILVGGHVLRLSLVRQRIALTPAALLIPKTFYSSTEKVIEYSRITALSVTSINPRRANDRVLNVEHQSQKTGASLSAAICEALLRGPGEFDEIVSWVRYRAPQARS